MAYARQFDPQVFHLDADAAQNTFFQGLAASGWHTAAVTMKLLVQSVPLGGGLIGWTLGVLWAHLYLRLFYSPSIASSWLEIYLKKIF